jgi:hypothetical protein
MKRTKISSALVSSLLSVAATLLAVLLTEVQLPAEREYATFVVFSFFIATLVILTLVYLGAYLADLQAARAEVESSKVIRDSFPTLVSFRRRTEVLEVSAAGDGVLTWDFDLESDLEESVPILTFPVLAETDPSRQRWTSISIDHIRVNGIEQDASAAFRPAEERILVRDMEGLSRNVPMIEYGLLHVPVELERGRRSSQVEVKMQMKGLFREARKMEVLFIDIPYFTRDLIVTIRSPDGPVRRSPELSGRTVLALSGLMDTADWAETARQDSQCQQVGDTLVWKAQTPKLGYRYKLYFRLEYNRKKIT